MVAPIPTCVKATGAILSPSQGWRDLGIVGRLAPLSEAQSPIYEKIAIRMITPIISAMVKIMLSMVYMVLT